jgi:hypothetical protein
LSNEDLSVWPVVVVTPCHENFWLTKFMQETSATKF